MSYNTLRLGAAQFASDCNNLEANIERHEHWITEGKKLSLECLVMPELSLTGHYGSMNLLEMAMRRNDPRLLKLAEMAGDMTVVVGFIEEGPGAQFYNASAMLKNGKVIYLHRKINIPNYGLLEEGKHFASGRFVDTFEIEPDWNVGLLICADAWNPALVHLSFLHGATLLMTPISSGIEAVGTEFDNPGGWTLTMKFYSSMYGAPSIMVNRTGVEHDLTFWGGSRILDAHGQEMAVAGEDPELIWAELDYNDIRKARRNLPTVRDSNFSLVLNETKRLQDTLGVPELIRD